jgi:hypothetical protein
MTITLAGPAAPPRVYIDLSGRHWALDRPFLDWHAAGWEWNGQPYDSYDGPVLHSIDDPARCERFLALVACAGLWQVPLNAQQDLAHWLDPLDEALSALALPQPVSAPGAESRDS